MNLPALITEIQSLDTALYKRAVSAVNVALTARNWLIGAYIVEFEQKGENRAAYGEKLIPELAKGLTIRGLSAATLWRCRDFYLAYPKILASLTREFPKLQTNSQLPILASLTQDSSSIPQSVTGESENPIPRAAPHDVLTHLSFTHIVELLKADEPLKRAFYEIEAIKGRWSVRELKRQMGSLLFERTGLSKNKEKMIELANQGATSLEPADVIRDPYIFEFLSLRARETIEETELETALLDHLQAFLLELGRGFCFEERQKKILIGFEHFFIDLVFYHRLLKCHVIIDLKVEPFTHGDIGQLNTYLQWYRKHGMSDSDNPPIRILLCTDKKGPLVEYALGGMDENLFVSEYKLQLPNAEELQAFLERELAKQVHPNQS